MTVQTVSTTDNERNDGVRKHTNNQGIRYLNVGGLGYRKKTFWKPVRLLNEVTILWRFNAFNKCLRRKIMDDDDIQEYESSGWRKRQIKSSGMDCCTYDCIQGRDCPIRKATLEEVAKEFDAMKSLGDTAASFAAFVRGMKK